MAEQINAFGHREMRVSLTRHFAALRPSNPAMMSMEPIARPLLILIAIFTLFSRMPHNAPLGCGPGSQCVGAVAA